MAFLKLAFADDSAHSRAVLHGILALTSLSLHGQHQARYHYTKALSFLIVAMHVSMRTDDRGLDSIHRLAASMLLTIYEV